MAIIMEPIGFVHTESSRVPRHWTLSDVRGRLVIDKKYQEGLKDIQSGQQIVAIFHFHKSPEFTPDMLVQKPPHLNEKQGAAFFKKVFMGNPDFFLTRFFYLMQKPFQGKRNADDEFSQPPL